MNELKISDAYNVVSSKISPEELTTYLSHEFATLYKKIKNRPVDEKCIAFQIFRMTFHQSICSTYVDVSDDEDGAIQNSLYDFIDCALSVLFFKNKFNCTPINEYIDDEFFYALLPYVIDRIEFPSLVQDEITESLKRNKRSNVHLQRRNIIANLMICSRSYVHQVIMQMYMHTSNQPTTVEIERVCKKHKTQYLSNVFARTDSLKKILNRYKQLDNKIVVFRGYDIDNSQDVILNRKVRLQDANKSLSFTLSKDVANMFALYKTNPRQSENMTSYDDRINLLSRFVKDDSITAYRQKNNRKFIVAKYLIDERDIIITPLSTTTTEYEVIANPNNARLIRYSIVSSTANDSHHNNLSHS